MNSDMAISLFCLIPSAFAEFDFPDKTLQQARPAAVDILAHRSARLRAHGFEPVMQEFDLRCLRPVGRKAHVNLGSHGNIRFPLRVDLPKHHQPMRRLPDRDGGYAGLRAVITNFEPAPAEPWLHQYFLNRPLADSMVMRPPSR